MHFQRTGHFHANGFLRRPRGMRLLRLAGTVKVIKCAADPRQA